MKIATATKDYIFSVGGNVLKKFEKNHSYVMSELLMKDIMATAGTMLFGMIRDLDSKTYKKYNGESLDDKTITIWRTGGMGDLCFITPYLKKIKEIYPTSKIIFGCGAQYAEVMCDHKYIDEFHNLPMDTEIMARSDFHLMFEGIIEANSEATKKNAYDLFGEYFCIQLEDHEKVPNLTVVEDSLKYFQELEKKYIKDPQPIKIGIHLKTSSKIRNVPIFIWTKLINEMFEMWPNVCIYLLGSHEDADVGNKISYGEKAVGKVLPFFALTRNFRDSIAAISEMNLIIGGDSSGLHTAAAFGKPMVGLFGAFQSKLRLATYENAIGMDSKIRCSPCFLHGNEPCDNSDLEGESYCMKIFDTQDIISEVGTLLCINEKIDLNLLPAKSVMMALSFYKEKNKEKQTNEA